AQGMPLPPPKPPKANPEKEFEEVERAMSVLAGEHPEAAKLRRQTKDLLEKRRVLDEEEWEREQKVKWRNRGIGLGVVIVVGIAGYFVWQKVKQEQTRVASIEHAVEPFKAKGFTQLASSPRSSPASFETTAEAGC